MIDWLLLSNNNALVYDALARMKHLILNNLHKNGSKVRNDCKSTCSWLIVL